MIEKVGDKWSHPQASFFNTVFSEHGMSFSPDGNSIYFSSTRPTGIDSIPNTWHIWKSENINGIWTKAIYIDIPNMRDKLISHPTISSSGKLYFHASNLDYSEMDVYHSQLIEGKFQNATKVEIEQKPNTGICTPFIAPNEEYLIFASIGTQLDLWISFNDGVGNWVRTKALNQKINHLGQGNPYVTSDHQFLFYATGEYQKTNWGINWVNIKSEID